MFILSDTTDPEIWIAEEAGFLALRERTGGHGRIFYRRRPKNIARKSGNIAEWVQRFGGAYHAVPDPRCRQPDERRDAGAAGRRDGAASRCRADPDAADHHRRDDAVRPRAAVRRARLRAADRARHRLVAWRRGQLLGPQRADPHARLRRMRGAAGTARPQAVRRADHEPRLRRGRADAARRLGDAHGAWRARQLRGSAADADRSRGARPALVPGQSAARGGAADARALRDQPAASADRHWVVS